MVRFKTLKLLPEHVVDAYTGMAKDIAAVRSLRFGRDRMSGTMTIEVPPGRDALEFWHEWWNHVDGYLQNLTEDQAVDNFGTPQTVIEARRNYLPQFTRIEQYGTTKRINTERRLPSEPSTADTAGLVKVVAEIRSELQSGRSVRDDEAVLERAIEQHITSEYTAEKELARSLGRIAVIDSNIQQLRDDLNSAVREARERGASWSDIGRALGIRPESAMRRWDPVAKEKHTSYQRQRGRGGYADS